MSPYKFVPFKLDVHAPWMHEQLENMQPTPSNANGVAAERDGEIVAVVYADVWTRTSCEAHICVKDPLVFLHGLHVEFFDYIFNTTGRRIIFAHVSEDNESLLEMVRHLGFTEAHCLEDAYAEGISTIIFRLDRADCKYLKEKEAA
jgi:RimJ/RimL family protein N-acetyltransferase